jgi:23S rRNA (guanosine2251-2'-O)-methyltransferase
MKTEILFGVHPVLEGLRAGRRKFEALYLARNRSGQRSETLAAAAESRGVPVRRISLEKLRSLAGSEFHQGVAAEAGPCPVVPVPALTGISDPFLLIIDSVVDPHNLGALIRTALCVGVDGVILPKDRAAAPTPVVSKASAGALEHIRLSLATNLARTLEDLKKQGIWISGTDACGPQSVFESDLTGPLAIVIGGEEKGIRPLVKRQCDFLITIPQKGPVNSLNASVAGAVVMYEAFRQRIASAGGPVRKKN